MNKVKLISLVITALMLQTLGTATAAAKGRSTKPATVQGVCNLNTAPVKKLVLLPYVGKSRANAIVRYRSRHPFRRTSDLMKIKGIGKSTYRRIKPHLTVTGPTTIRKIRAQKSRRRKSRRRR
jgi:competence protein ComEA